MDETPPWPYTWPLDQLERGWLGRTSKKVERKNNFSLGFKKQEGEVVWGVFSSLVGVFFCKKGKKKGANESLKKGSK